MVTSCWGLNTQTYTIHIRLITDLGLDQPNIDYNYHKSILSPLHIYMIDCILHFKIRVPVLSLPVIARLWMLLRLN